MFRPVRQRLVRTHPVTGRKSLYLSSHAGGIVGMPMPEARVLLRDLNEHATQPKFVYVHTWRPWDLVMWDNRQMMHRVRRYDESQPRDMRRTTVAGDAPTTAQVPAWRSARPFRPAPGTARRPPVEAIEVGDAVEQAHPPRRRPVDDRQRRVLPALGRRLALGEDQMPGGEGAAHEAVGDDREVAAARRGQRPARGPTPDRRAHGSPARSRRSGARSPARTCRSRAPSTACRGDRRSSVPAARARRRGARRSPAAGARPWPRRGRSRSTRCATMPASARRRASRSACTTPRGDSGMSGRWTIRRALPSVSPWRIRKSRLSAPASCTAARTGRQRRQHLAEARRGPGRCSPRPSRGCSPRDTWAMNSSRLVVIRSDALISSWSAWTRRVRGWPYVATMLPPA